MLRHPRSRKEEQSCQSGAFQLNAFAILFSSYEPILYLNNDRTALREAIQLCVVPSTGFLLWPDYWIATEDPVLYNLTRVPSLLKWLPARSSKADQLLMSQQIHLNTLLLVAYYPTVLWS